MLFVQNEVQIFLCYSSSSPIAELHSSPPFNVFESTVGYILEAMVDHVRRLKVTNVILLLLSLGIFILKPIVCGLTKKKYVRN